MKEKKERIESRRMETLHMIWVVGGFHYTISTKECNVVIPGKKLFTSMDQ